jgi:hypothetical protein
MAGRRLRKLQFRESPVTHHSQGSIHWRPVWSPGSADPENSWWKWANGFSAYLNWFQIDKHNLIGSFGAQGVVDLATPPPGNFVVRNPVTTQITDVTTAYLNSGNGRAEGIANTTLTFGINNI